MPETLTKFNPDLESSPGQLRLDSIEPFTSIDSMNELEKQNLERAMLLFDVVEKPEGFVPKTNQNTIDKAKDRIELFAQNSKDFSDLMDNLIAANPNMDVMNFVDNLKTNKDLRVAVGLITLRRIDELGLSNSLPERVQQNTYKNPRLNTTAKAPGLKSREYSAQLMLAMLNGTFNDAEHGDGPIEIGPDGKAISGQHRAAALEAIGDSY